MNSAPHVLATAASALAMLALAFGCSTKNNSPTLGGPFDMQRSDERRVGTECTD